MGFVRMSSGDPLTDSLRTAIGANIVKIPEERVKPLAVVAARGDRTAFRGSLSEILVDKPELGIRPVPSQMSGLADKRSKKISFDVGLGILKNFLAGFQVPSAGLEMTLQGATEVSFSFNNVVRQSVDKDELGSILQGKRVAATHPSAAIFFGPDAWDLLLIDSTITSSDFTLSVDNASQSDFKIDLAAIQSIVDRANVGVSVSLTANRVLTFKGRKHLAFAFTCVRIYLGPNGKVSIVAEDERKHALAATTGAGGARQSIRISAPHVLLSDKSSTIEWDEWPI